MKETIMFNLDHAIQEWRRHLMTDGVNAPDVLTELENHLREDIDQQMRAGISAQDAFARALPRIGQPRVLRSEFAKLGENRERRILKLIGIAFSTFAGAFSLIILPKLFHHEISGIAERLLGLAAIALTMLSIPAWHYGQRFLPVIRNRRARRTVSLMCCFSGLIWMWSFITMILPHLLQLPGEHSDFPVGRVIVTVAWAFALLAVLGGMAYGLEEAANTRCVIIKSKEQHV